MEWSLVTQIEVDRSPGQVCAASFSILNLHILNITSHFKRNVEIFLTQIVEETPSGLCVAIVYIILHITSGNMSALGLGAHT